MELADYDLRHVAHLAACEGHIELLEFLIKDTKFDFELSDRWGRTAMEELSHTIPRDEKIRLKKLIREHRD